MNPGQQLLEAMVRGVERAGFVNARGRHMRCDYGNGVTVAVFADCPCGLGTSSVAQRFSGEELKQLPIEDTAARTEERAYQLGKAHIEEDRRKGRWTDNHHPAEAKPHE